MEGLFEDEIQCLAFRTGIESTMKDPFPLLTTTGGDNKDGQDKRLTGLSLRVEKWGSEDPQHLFFNTTMGNKIEVGRKPPSNSRDHKKNSYDLGKALFRCPVVSRRHAEITFSRGQAYIQDLHSHHGTHIKKESGSISRRVSSTTPTLLQDGDIVTFGKSVGRNEEVFMPVVAQIQLHYGGKGSNPLYRPSSPPSVIDLGTPPRSPNRSPKSTSGRYGLDDDVESSPSSGESDNEENEYSGPEEVSSKAEPSRLPPLGFGAFRMEHKSHVPLPAIPTLFPCWNNSSSFLVDTTIQQEVQDKSDDSIRSTPEPEREVVGAWPGSPSPHQSEEEEEVQPEEDVLDYFRAPAILPANDITERDSQQPSDPCSSVLPSPPISPVKGSDPVYSPFEVPKTGHDVHSGAQLPESPSIPRFDSFTPEVDLIVGAQPPSYTPLNIDMGSIMKDGLVNETLSRDSPAVSYMVRNMKQEVEQIQLDISKLNTTESHFQSDLTTFAGRLDGFDIKIKHLNDLCSGVIEQADTSTHFDIPELQAQIDSLRDGLQAQIDCLTDRVEFDLKNGRETARLHKEVDNSLDRMMREAWEENLKQIVDQAKKDIQDSLAIVKKAEIDAIQNIQNAVEEAHLSLKRKRIDEEETILDPYQSEHQLGASSPTETAIVLPPPPKRARRIGQVVAHTATTLTVGAVLAWSILAFS